MDNSDPFTSTLPTIFGAGLVGLLVMIALIVIGFIISAFITSLWVRLILVFMRKALDREYGRMRMVGQGFVPGKLIVPTVERPSGTMPLRNGDGPRDWTTL